MLKVLKGATNQMSDRYNFNISLSVLNHLGRNLYRNLITVIGEAISNSWDADAQNVYIEIDRSHNSMIILDDGKGMTSDDFQNKFLKIGYSKRKGGSYKSDSGRPFIGRKGIGKLALLSCAKRIHVLSKSKDEDFVGGIIDNSELDKAITDDLNSQDYILEPIDEAFESNFENRPQGTLLYFESITEGILNTVEYIKKAIALYFRFSLYDNTFCIYVNGEKIDETFLKEFAEETQFLWKINGFTDPTYRLMENAQVVTNIPSSMSIKGFIASVKKPSNLKVRGTQEKVSIDLFVNGRLREKDVLRHIPTARIVENYVYGQIHFDLLDNGDAKDIFTSNRESVVADDPQFIEFLTELDRIFKIIIEEWDDYRRRHGDDGDPDNPKVTRKARKAQELFNTTFKEMEGSKAIIKRGSKVDKWAQELSEEAQFNIPSYTECFISENLLRRYIQDTGMKLTAEAVKEAQRWREREGRSKNAANISYDVRTSNDDIYYLDMDHLANLVDKPADKTKDAGIGRSAIVYKPIRDAVGHTSIISNTAKTQLTIVFENIKARLMELLVSVNENEFKE